VTFRLPTFLCAPALLLSACGPGGGNPFASFESRCATLDPPRFEVVATPLTFERNDGESIEALTTKSGSALATHRAIGLTTAVFGQSTDIELHAVGDHRGGQACGMPRVHVELSMQPVTVFVARELAGVPCQRDITLSHEMKHVDVFREVLSEATHDLERELPETIGTELRRAKNPEELQQRLIIAVRDYLAQFMHERQRVLDERQAEVDSPEEYARVSTACQRSVADLTSAPSETP
jgi:hypothetical protein